MRLAIALLATLLCPLTAPADLVSWYKAEQNANDSAGTNHGSFDNPQYAAGVSGFAFDMTGSNYVEVPDNNSLDFTNALTLAAWVRPESLAEDDGTTAIIWKGTNIASASGQSYLLGLVSDDQVNNFAYARISDGTTFYQTARSGPIPLDAYTHLAATFDGDFLRFYVNGALTQSTAADPSSIFNSSTPLFIGASASGDTPISLFDGQIDDVRLYNHALSAEAVATVAVPEAGSFAAMGLAGLLAAGGAWLHGRRANRAAA
jgi:hypothetical protein